jgi:DNA-binding NarL/FixJ family response regulator
LSIGKIAHLQVSEKILILCTLFPHSQLMSKEKLNNDKEKVTNYFNDHPAEREVLQLLCDGKPVKKIPDERNTSISTVRHQIESIHKALKVQDNTQAVVRGLRYGIISFPTEDE